VFDLTSCTAKLIVRADGGEADEGLAANAPCGMPLEATLLAQAPSQSPA
jgi:hypothetical protein